MSEVRSSTPRPKQRSVPKVPLPDIYRPLWAKYGPAITTARDEVERNQQLLDEIGARHE